MAHTRTDDNKRIRVRRTGRLIAGTIPAVVAATATVAGSGAQAAVSPRADTGQAQTQARFKKVVVITWHDAQGDHDYLEITGASKKSGALAVTAPKKAGSDNQKWRARYLDKFSFSGAALWSFQNVHSGLCLAIGGGIKGGVGNHVVQRPCGKHFGAWPFIESRTSTDINNHRKFLGYLLENVKPGEKKSQAGSKVICPTTHNRVFTETFSGATAADSCLWR